MFSTLLGIDAGTSSVKVIVADPSRGVLGTASRAYRNEAPHPGWSEQDPEEWWSATVAAAAEALEQARKQGNVVVRGIAVTGQMHSFVLVDRQYRPLRRAITWLDTRARDLVPEIQSVLDAKGLSRGIANRVASGLTLPPLVWLRRNEPEILNRAAALLMVKDYLRLRLTGTIGADPTDGSATLLMDVGRRQWIPELEALFGVSQEILPPLSDPWEVAGTVRADLHQQFGGRSTGGAPMGEDIVVAVGSGDQQAAALANGVLRPGVIQMMVGTGGQIATPLDHLPEEPPVTLNHFCHHRNWLAQGSIQNGGAALTWVQNLLGAEWRDYETAMHSADLMEAPLFVPYLTGERTPLMDAGATGSWMRLRQTTSRDDLLYAAVEGVVFGFTDALDEVRRQAGGGQGFEIRVGGGGTRSTRYIRLLCDVVGEPLTVMPHGNTTALGAAILGGVAAGTFSDLDQGVAALGVGTATVIQPDMERHHLLSQRRDLFHRLRRDSLTTGE